MRKLALVSILCLAAAVPAIAAPLDEPDRASAGQPSSHANVSPARGNPRHVREAKRKLALALRRARPPKPKSKRIAVPSHLQAIAQCESGGDPTAIGGGGLYRGKYQFSVATWQAVGGSGDPAAAPEAEQDRRAIMLYEQSGPGQWPVCGS
jgi:hypothetical protein